MTNSIHITIETTNDRVIKYFKKYLRQENVKVSFLRLKKNENKARYYALDFAEDKNAEDVVLSFLNVA